MVQTLIPTKKIVKVFNEDENIHKSLNSDALIRVTSDY
jgi:hypothetical protein